MRQAIILIHGIGEQRPMGTVRDFVTAVLDGTGDASSEIYSKPDLMSESFELRRLVAAKTRSRPMTDFYEYYWAHHMDGTKLSHVWPWLRAILLRWPWTVPSKLRVLWALSWALVAAGALVYLASRIGVSGAWPPWLLSGLLFGVFAIVQYFAVTTIGDAARYLSPSPANIAIRQKIRSEGIALLRRIHERGQYDRVIVVGHSLGSVIGYDMLTHFWAQVNTRHAQSERPRQRMLEKLEACGAQLTATPSADARLAYRTAQREMWLEARGLGFPWLVTDFVTLGSPLAHAAILLARDEDELRERQRQRELAITPPIKDDKHYSFNVRYDVTGGQRSIRILHHAAQYAPTRWTNVYFPLVWGMLGDFVGGPLEPVFGPGVLDVALTEGWARHLPVVPHTQYWCGTATAPGSGRVSALAALRDALELDASSWLPRSTRSAEPLAVAPAADGDAQSEESQL